MFNPNVTTYHSAPLNALIGLDFVVDDPHVPWKLGGIVSPTIADYPSPHDVVKSKSKNTMLIIGIILVAMIIIGLFLYMKNKHH